MRPEGGKESWPQGEHGPRFRTRPHLWVLNWLSGAAIAWWCWDALAKMNPLISKPSKCLDLFQALLALVI